MIQPTFVTHLPKELVPLAKLSPDDPPARPKPLRRGEGPTTVEVFVLCINGQEIAPGSPVGDRARLARSGRRPADQPERTITANARVAWLLRANAIGETPMAATGTVALPNPIEQRERLEHQAGGEQQKPDFLVALEHGMPSAGGIGVGIDRLCPAAAGLLGQRNAFAT